MRRRKRRKGRGDGGAGGGRASSLNQLRDSGQQEGSNSGWVDEKVISMEDREP